MQSESLNKFKATGGKLEQIIPFRVEPGEAIEVRPTSESGTKLSIVVVLGGPVFLVKGRVPEADIANSLDTNPDFALAASATSPESFIGISQRYGESTLYNHGDEVAIGFIKVTA